MSFKKNNQTLPVLPRRKLSQTQATEDYDDLNDTLNSHDDSQDQIQTHMGMGVGSSAGPTARDALLLKCRDAIESLHIELEEERQEKQRTEKKRKEKKQRKTKKQKK